MRACVGTLHAQKLYYIQFGATSPGFLAHLTTVCVSHHSINNHSRILAARVHLIPTNIIHSLYTFDPVRQRTTLTTTAQDYTYAEYHSHDHSQLAYIPHVEIATPLSNGDFTSQCTYRSTYLMFFEGDH